MLILIFSCFLIWLDLATALSLKQSSIVDIIGSNLADASVDVVPDPSFYSGASDVIKGIAQVPGPSRVLNSRLLDPAVQRANSCDRNFGTTCPQGFMNIGAVKGGSAEVCRAAVTYDTPCNSEVYDFNSMTIAEKARWSDQCLAFWPCRKCERQYENSCPRDWIVAGEGKCAPTLAYSGPCDHTMNFKNFNSQMFELWSSECEAFWPCA